MEILMAILVGILYTAGVYMLLRRSILKFIIGIILLSNATNLLVFLSAGLVAGKPVFLGGEEGDSLAYADPLPQALVLTSIVIGLGVLALMVALCVRLYERYGTFDVTEIRRLRG